MFYVDAKKLYREELEKLGKQVLEAQKNKAAASSKAKEAFAGYYFIYYYYYFLFFRLFLPFIFPLMIFFNIIYRGGYR